MIHLVIALLVGALLCILWMVCEVEGRLKKAERLIERRGLR